MKYQCLVSLALAALSASTVSAGPLLKREDDGQCPPGYSMSVYYVTVTAELSTVPATTPAVESTTVPASSPTTVKVTATPEPIESTTSEAVASTTPEVSPLETYIALEPSTTFSTEELAIPSVEEQVQPTTTAAPAPVTTSEAQPTTTSTASAATSSSSSSSQGSVNAGKATFYGGNVSGGTCSFTGYTLPSNIFGTALSAARWDDAAQCGSCVAVTGPNGNTVKAMIVDKCPECESNHLDLFQDAFGQLANIAEGVISIDWSYVSCDIDSPFVLKNKEGTSQYWFAMQVVNANEPITSLEVSTDGGSTWQGTTRSFYNYFENSTGFGTETLDVRVTGESGQSIVVKNVGCSSAATTTASGNF